MAASGLSLGQDTDRLSPDRRSGSDQGRAAVRGAEQAEQAEQVEQVEQVGRTRLFY